MSNFMSTVFWKDGFVGERGDGMRARNPNFLTAFFAPDLVVANIENDCNAFEGIVVD